MTMKRILLTLLLACSVSVLFADDGRPKLKENNEKKIEKLKNGGKCLEKKGLWGYADAEYKFVIPAVFAKVEPFNEGGQAFVAYMMGGRMRWTPIDISGVYLTGLEFDEPGVFDKAGFAKVVTGGRYGMIDAKGKMVVPCEYPQVEEYGSCYVFHGEDKQTLALVHEDNDKGHGLYTFAAGAPIVLTVNEKCGIVSPETYQLVAPFEFDAYQVTNGDFYFLTAGKKKAVYTSDRLSSLYDNISLSDDSAYLITHDFGRYGALNLDNEVLIPCDQTEMPVLDGNYRLFTLSDGTKIFSTNRKWMNLTSYDEHLRDSCLATPSKYILDTLIPLNLKQFTNEMLSLSYGTKEFEALRDEDVALDYAEAKRLMLIVNAAASGSYYDVDLKKTVKLAHKADHSINVDGRPAYVTVIENGNRKGLLDVWTGSLLLPCDYDSFELLGSDYAVMRQSDSLRLYNLVNQRLVFDDWYNDVVPAEGYDGLIVLSKKGKKGVYDLRSSKWLLPAEFEDVRVCTMTDAGNEEVICAEVVKEAKHGLYDLVSGQPRAECVFDDIIGGNLKELRVVNRSKFGIYDTYVKDFVMPCSYDEIIAVNECFYNEMSHRLVTVRNGRNMGLFDLSIKKLVLPVQSLLMEVLDNYACISNGGGFTVMDLKTRNNVFTSTFRDAKLLPDGYVIVNESSNASAPKYGVYNLNVRSWVVQPVEGTVIADMGRGYISYKGVKEDGILDYKDGRWICRTDGAEEMVLHGDKYAVITADHNYLKGIYDVRERAWLLNQEYENVSIHNALTSEGKEYERYAIVVNMYSKYGFMDLSTKEFVLGSVYDGIEMVGHDVLMVRSGGQNAAYDVQARKWIMNLRDEQIVISEKDGILDVKAGAESLQYDLKNHAPVVPVDYHLPFTAQSVDDSYLADTGLLMVAVEGKWGLYDTAQKAVVVPCENLRIEPMYSLDRK